MKKSLYLFAFMAGMLSMTGCSKKINDTENNNIAEVKSINLADLSAATGSLRIAITDAPALIPDVSGRNINRSANGNFSDGVATSAVFSAIQNPAGTFGLGFTRGAIEIDIQNKCISVEGNRAVMGGHITKVTHHPPGLEQLFAVGNYVYLMVEDNGEGNNATPDRFNTMLLFSFPPAGPICHILSPGSGFWQEATIRNIAPGGHIQVK